MERGKEEEEMFPIPGVESNMASPSPLVVQGTR